jgi:hypothetical protein
MLKLIFVWKEDIYEQVLTCNFVLICDISTIFGLLFLQINTNFNLCRMALLDQHYGQNHRGRLMAEDKKVLKVATYDVLTCIFSMVL